MAKNKIDTLTEKRNQLNVQIQALQAEEQSKKRKDDTRRKILIGGVVLKMLKTNEMPKQQLNQILDKHLDRERDRKLFGLPTKTVEPSGA